MKTGLILQQQHIYHPPTNNILLIIPPTEREKEKKEVPNKSILTIEFKKERGATLLSPPDELILRDLHYHTPHDTYRRHNSSLAEATVEAIIAGWARQCARWRCSFLRACPSLYLQSDQPFHGTASNQRAVRLSMNDQLQPPIL